MAINERIQFFRNLRGLTQKNLGAALGFPENSADIRVAQYESGSRKPKTEITEKLAEVLDVSPKALDVPDIDGYVGLMHTLFALEDIYGLKVTRKNGRTCLCPDFASGGQALLVMTLLDEWMEQREKLLSGAITEEEYDQWRYRFPEIGDPQIPSSEPKSHLIDAMEKGANRSRRARKMNK